LAAHQGFSFIGKQMSQAGGVIAFELKTEQEHGSSQGIEQGKRFINSMGLFSIAVSLGDAESLIQHPASMTHSPYTPQERMDAGISDGLIRISVGLENVEDIIADLQQALDMMTINQIISSDDVQTVV